MVAAAVFTTPTDEYRVEKVKDDLYQVSTARGVRGFVEHVGSVYVALEGSRYQRSVEVGQSLTFDRAAAMLGSRA